MNYVNGRMAGPVGLARGEARRMSGILDSLYEAVLSSQAWESFVTAVADALPGSAVVLHGMPLAGARQSMHCGGIGREFSEMYRSHYHALNPWTQGRLKFRRGSIYFAEDVLLRAELVETEFYKRWLRPQALGSWVGLSLAGLSFDPLFFDIHMSLEASARDRAKLLRVMRLLRPHLSRALRLHSINHSTATAVNGGNEHLDDHLTTLANLPLAAAVFDCHHRLVHVNGPAERIFGSPGGSDGTGIRDAASASLLKAGLDTALAGGVFGPFTLSRKVEGRFTGTIVPYSCKQSFRGVEAGEPPYAAVFLFQSGRMGVAQKQDLIGRVLGLTQAESSVTLALASGKTLSEYAAERRVSLNTAKSQLASAFAKTGTTRQADLILVLQNHFNW